MKVAKEYAFSASHFIPNHPGKCANLHGHNYKVRVIVDGPTNPTTGMVIDFYDIDAYVKPLVDILDHNGNVNDHLDGALSTAENIAKWFWLKLGAMVLAVSPGPLFKQPSLTVRVYETEKCYAEYNGG